MTAADPGASLRALARAVDLQQRGRLDEAEAVYARLLAGDDRDATVLINAGVLAMARGQVAAAVERLQKACAVVPGNAVAHANLGFALIRAGRAADALSSLDRAVALKPDLAQAHNNRGIALARLGRFAEARSAFEAVLRMAPANAEAAVNLGELCNRAGDSSAAREAFARVRDDDPRAVQAAIGNAFSAALDGRLEEAIASLERLVAARPDEPAAWQTLGAVRNWSWRHEEAEAAFRRALDLAPGQRDARFGLASSLLARGRYVEGFAAFEQSRAGIVPPSPRLRALAAWDGTPLDGTLAVHGEQGLGDYIQFARFVPSLRTRVRRLVLVLDGYWQPLAPLLASLEGVDAIVDDGGLAAEPALARASVLSLPFLAHATPQALPPPPYLAPPADRLAAWSRTLAPLPGRRVGLAWSVFARDDHAYVSRHKSIPVAALAPLLAVQGVSFVSLQPGVAGDTAALGPNASRVAPLGRDVRDFGDTAALVAAVDLVVSVDTAVAHVAGALGKPVALLERFHGCWRWRLSPRTSPWYPSLSIFRQERFGDWTGPVAAVAAMLEGRDPYQ